VVARTVIAFGYHGADSTRERRKRTFPSLESAVEEAMLIFRRGAMGKIPEISVSLSQVCGFCGDQADNERTQMTSLRAARPVELLRRSTASRGEGSLRDRDARRESHTGQNGPSHSQGRWRT
jgi:hypothetical protein